MGCTCPSMPRVPVTTFVTKEQAKQKWFRKEAERELQSFLQGISFSYISPPDKNYEEGVGYIFPPKGF